LVVVVVVDVGVKINVVVVGNVNVVKLVVVVVAAKVAADDDDDVRGWIAELSDPPGPGVVLVQVESAGVILTVEPTRSSGIIDDVILGVELARWSTGALVAVDDVFVDAVLDLLVVVAVVLGDVGSAGVNDEPATDVDSNQDLVETLLFPLIADDPDAAEVLNPSETADVHASGKLTKLDNSVDDKLALLFVKFRLEKVDDVKNEGFVEDPASTLSARHPTFVPGSGIINVDLWCCTSPMLVSWYRASLTIAGRS